MSMFVPALDPTNAIGSGEWESIVGTARVAGPRLYVGSWLGDDQIFAPPTTALLFVLRP